MERKALMNDSYPGLWYIMPPALLDEAVKHGHYRQSRALTRKSKWRWYGTVAELTEHHVQEAKLEAAAAHCIGVPWLKRVDTDHDQPRLDIPGTRGAWVRVCRKWQNPARLKARPEDYGVVISGRLHEEHIQGCPITLVEVRAFAMFDDIKANYPLENPGDRRSASGEKAECYLVPWAMQHVHPIEDLITRHNLSVPSDVMPYALSSVSDMIHFSPQQRGDPDMRGWPRCPHCNLPNFPRRTTCYHCGHSLVGATVNGSTKPRPKATAQCDDGCPDRRPSAAGGFVCNICGFFLFR